MERRHIVFHGRVQGVGFRITLFQKAMKYQLTGWVRNLSNGCVESCLQGPTEKINRVIQDMNDIIYIQIDDIEQEACDVLPREKQFEIKY